MERKSESNNLGLVFREISLETGEVLTQIELRANESFSLVERQDSESVKVTLCSDGKARVEVRELTPNKDAPDKLYTYFASHLWDPTAIDKEPENALNRAFVWTRNCPLPLGVNYNPENLAITWEDEKVKKLLTWVG